MSQIESEFGNVGFWAEGKTGVPREKPLEAKERTLQQTQPTYGFDAGIWTQATQVGGERSHHCDTFAPLKNAKMFFKSTEFQK